MKVCEAKKGFVSFENNDEFEAWFKKLAGEEELNDSFCVEGNSNLNYCNVKDWVEYFGIENVYFEKDSFENGCGFLDEFFFDLKNAKHSGKAFINRADEMSICNGFLRIWFD